MILDDYKKKLQDKITKKDYVFDEIDMQVKSSMQKARGLIFEDK